MTAKTILTFKEGGTNNTYSYSLSSQSQGRVAGAFRAIEVAPLQQTTPEIRLREWANIKFPDSPDETRIQNDLGAVQYVAVSHVWEYSNEVQTFLKSATRPRLLPVNAGNGKKQNLSWVGLVQMANAAAMLGRRYLWLDLLCVDEADLYSDDKALQICIMGKIYRYSKNVIVMIGGAACVQSVGSPTGWMDRAWTLQESVVNRDMTYVYVNWPYKTKRWVDKGKTYKFLPVNGEPTNCLIKLLDLLDAADMNLKQYMTGPPNIVVLDGMSPRPRQIPRHALRAAVSRSKAVRCAGIWRSLFLRTSKYPVDMVYSIMGIFGLQIDPYRQVRTPDYLFNDLARKTATLGAFGPAWLTIGGVTGSSIPRSKESRVIPEFPNTAPNTLPTYSINGASPKWVGQFVDASSNYVRNYDIKFVTHSHPHIINAHIFRIRHISTKRMRRNMASLSLGYIRGTCYYRGDLKANWRDTEAVYVGEISYMGFGSSSRFNGWRYFLFCRWDKNNGRWDVVADGAFRPRRGTWRLPKERWIFTIGRQAQDFKKRWPQSGHQLLDQRRHMFRHHSYGYIPLDDYRVDDPEKRKIKWAGYLYEKPETPSWKKHSIDFDTTGISTQQLNKRLKLPTPLHFVSCFTDNPPKYRTDKTPFRLMEMGALEMLYSYSRWNKPICAALAKAGVEGIIIPNGGYSTGDYYMAVQFGKHVIYLKTKPHTDTRFEFEQIYVIPYRRVVNILNSKYIIPPPPPQPAYPEPQPVVYQPAPPLIQQQTPQQRWQAQGYIPTEEYNRIVQPQGYPGVTNPPNWLPPGYGRNCP